jgi:hypothetical protein
MPTFLKKLQILLQKTFQFINAVNGVSHSYKTANIFCYVTVSQHEAGKT